ncbi:MAG: gliding motility-associated C-terminal domain-containing protein [Candidatus Latescibacteria bacterium]|nr:gliding motility-associated C-terminal domain-containing protein [Candidatus Latescibacterota bacterium]
MQLKTDAFFDFARLDSLQVEIAPLLADRVVGEVVLEEDHQPQGGRVRVPAGEKKSFVYDIGVEFSSADRTGFDVVRVMTPAEAEFGWLEIGEPLGTVEPDSIANEESGFVVFLPRRLSPEGDQRLRIGLETVLYDEAGEFGGEVFNRGEQSLLQRVEGGDVSEELVASASSARGVLEDLEVGSRAFTPQGDGVNDQLSIQYTLFRVQQASAVKVGIYALNGRRIWQAQPEAQAAGRHMARWDGRDGAGQLVGPGIYLARVEVETDKGSEIRLQPVAVAY